MSKITEFCNALTTLGDGRYHYWNGSSGVGCSDYVRMALALAGVITNAEACDPTNLWAGQGYRKILQDTTRFTELPASTVPQKGDIYWYQGHHVSVCAGYPNLWEAAPEASHGICSNGKTGVGLWKNHNYNCSGGSLTCLYRIKEGDNLTIIDKIMAKADEIANDNSHGYNNTVGKNLGYPDYDCGAFVSACIRSAGLINSSTVFEPNQPDGTWGYDVILTAAGFTKMAYNANTVQRGDVLIKSGRHTELAYGNGKQIGAHNDYDGKTGDSSGNEISVVNLYTNYWEYMYRYNETTSGHTTLQYGSTGSEVKTLQTLLNSHGASLDVDGSFGNLTKQAVISFQTANNLVVDGIVGQQTWTALEAEVEPTKELTAKERLQIAIDIIDGKYGSGSDRKNKLIAEFGETEAVKIQNIVNTAF